MNVSATCTLHPTVCRKQARSVLIEKLYLFFLFLFFKSLPYYTVNTVLLLEVHHGSTENVLNLFYITEII